MNENQKTILEFKQFLESIFYEKDSNLRKEIKFTISNFEMNRYNQNIDNFIDFETINKDVNRSNFYNSLNNLSIEEHRIRLYKNLKIFFYHNNNFEYTQGVNMIMAFLQSIFEKNEDALYFMCKLADRIANNYFFDSTFDQYHRQLKSNINKAIYKLSKDSNTLSNKINFLKSQICFKLFLNSFQSNVLVLYTNIMKNENDLILVIYLWTHLLLNGIEKHLEKV